MLIFDTHGTKQGNAMSVIERAPGANHLIEPISVARGKQTTETGWFQFRAEARERICSRSSSTAKTGVVSSLTTENYFIWNGHYA